MNSNETLEMATVFIGSAAGLIAIYHAGKFILKSLGLWHSSNVHKNSNNSSKPSASMGSPQNVERDQRPVGRQVQHGGTRHRSRPQ